MPRSPFSPRLIRLLLATAVIAVVVVVAPSRAAVFDPLPEPRLLRVPLGGAVTLEALQSAGLDIAEVHGSREALIVAWPQDEAALASRGIRAELLDAHPGRTAATLARRELAAGTRPAGIRVVGRSRPGGVQHLESLPPFGSGSMGGYWTNAEVKAKLDELVADDVNDVVADTVDSIGVSVQGRPIWGLMLGKSVTGPDSRPIVLLNALTHAREPGGMQALFYFVDDLLAGYGIDPWKTYLLDHRRIYICPVVNPDGYEINYNTYLASGGTAFGMWRKNARDNNGNHTFDSGDGVDLNRNYGYKFGIDEVGSSSSPSSDIYRGPGAFSEPETQAQRDLIVRLQPKSAISFHTFSDLFLHPWGYQVNAAPDSSAFYEWDDEGTFGNGYDAGQSTRVLYEVNGEFNDWCYGDTLLKPRMFTWTPEAGSSNDGFWPPPSRMVPISQDNLRGCYLAAAIAGPYVRAQSYDVTEGAMPIGNYAHVTVRARNLGLAPTGASLNATLVSLDPGAEVLSGALSYPALGSRASGDAFSGGSFLVGTADTLTPGRLLRFRVEFRDADGLYCRDTVEVAAGQPTVLLNDPSNNFTSWLIGGAWGIVSNDPRHPSKYFADSPSGVYPSNYNGRFTMKGSLDLSAVPHAWIRMDARWGLETHYDGTMVEASLDSVNWTALPGRATVAGISGGAQPLGQPVYEGQRFNWRTERVDLTPFCSPAATRVRLRFRTVSDGGTEFDGFNFDSLRIEIYDPSAQPATVAVGPIAHASLEFSAPAPNPAVGRTVFSFSLPRAGRARLEVMDIAGRRVALLADERLTPNRYVRGWDLRDDQGRVVVPGVYLARLSTVDGARLQRVVVIH